MGVGRLQVGLLLCCVFLLPYFWFTGQQDEQQGDPAAALGTLWSSLPTDAPYLLLNETRPPPLEELNALGDADDDALLDLRGFRWLQRGDPAGIHEGDPLQETTGCSPLVLVLVHSAPGNMQKRQFIRETWGSAARREEVLVRFVLGLPATGDCAADAVAQHRLDAEAEAFGDLVQGPFADTYRNLTYKHAMALKWFARRCPRATYLLKLDDDVLVNTGVLLDFTRRALSPHGARDLLVCVPELHAMVKRSYRSKWRVSYAEFPARQYPAYCSGWAVMYSPDVALRLYREVQLWARGSPYFWVDDVLVTGILAARLGLTHASWEPLVLARQDLQRVLRGELRPAFMIASLDLLDVGADTERLLWQRIVSEPHDETKAETHVSEITGTHLPTSPSPRSGLSRS